MAALDPSLSNRATAADVDDFTCWQHAYSGFGRGPGPCAPALGPTGVAASGPPMPTFPMGCPDNGPASPRCLAWAGLRRGWPTTVAAGSAADHFHAALYAGCVESSPECSRG